MEFIGRTLNSGTYMPLTMYCAQLDVDFYIRSSRSVYARQEAVIKGNYKLTNLGKLRFRILKEMEILDRSTCGTIALWSFRKNERNRQLRRIKKHHDMADWIAPKRVYQNNIEPILQVYKYALQRAINYLNEIINDKDSDRLLKYIFKFIREYEKQQVSMIARERYPYYHIIEGHVDVLELAKYFVKLLEYIILNIYSVWRLNPRFILSAIRNRPLEIMNISETVMNGWMDRSREANGQPPLAALWMMVYEIKNDIIINMLNMLESIYKVKFFDPIRDRDFYWRFTHFNDGLYLFGDNGLLIKGGEIITMYDLAISDVYQGFLRRDEINRNLCFYQRLNDNFDCGSTGGAFTTIWNLDGQLCMWRAYNDGLLSTSKEWPEIAELCESSKTFLGHFYNARMQRWMTIGNRLSKDNARKAIPIRVRRGRSNRIRLEQKDVKTNEFAQLVISSGLGRKKLRKFYDWVRLMRLSINPEELGVAERIGEVIPESKLHDFISMFKPDRLAVLARPLNFT